MNTTLRVAFCIVVLCVVTAASIVIDGQSDNIQSADVTVVLGNKVEVDGTPSLRLKSRLDKAIDLYDNGISTLFIVSGGVGKEGYQEATVMRDYLVKEGIRPDQVIVDNEGYDTFQTAQNTSKIMRDRGLSSALIVTNFYHISRTRLALKKFGIETVYSAHADYFESRDLYSIAREVIGFYYYLVRPLPIEAI